MSSLTYLYDRERARCEELESENASLRGRREDEPKWRAEVVPNPDFQALPPSHALAEVPDASWRDQTVPPAAEQLVDGDEMNQMNQMNAGQRMAPCHKVSVSSSCRAMRSSVFSENSEAQLTFLQPERQISQGLQGKDERNLTNVVVVVFFFGCPLLLVLHT